MGLVYLPTFTIKISHVGKYTSPMDPMGLGVFLFFFFRILIGDLQNQTLSDSLVVTYSSLAIFFKTMTIAWWFQEFLYET